MKKLMIALAVVAVAMATQAASIAWKFTSDKNADEYAGSKVYLIAATALPVAADFTSVDTLANWLKEQTVVNGSPVATGKKNGMTGKYTNSGALTDDVITKTDTYYLLFANSDASEVQTSALIAGSSWAYGETDQPVTFTIGQSDVGAWMPVGSVPEPTTGVLVLLGMAGLALRRKQK